VIAREGLGDALRDAARAIAGMTVADDRTVGIAVGGIDRIGHEARLPLAEHTQARRPIGARRNPGRRRGLCDPPINIAAAVKVREINSAYIHHSALHETVGMPRSNPFTFVTINVTEHRSIAAASSGRITMASAPNPTRSDVGESASDAEIFAYPASTAANSKLRHVRWACSPTTRASQAVITLFRDHPIECQPRGLSWRSNTYQPTRALKQLSPK